MAERSAGTEEGGQSPGVDVRRKSFVIAMLLLCSCAAPVVPSIHRHNNAMRIRVDTVLHECTDTETRRAALRADYRLRRLELQLVSGKHATREYSQAGEAHRLMVLRAREVCR